MATAGEINCLANPDFAVICSFLDRYGETLGLPKIGYANLQEWIEDSRKIHPQLIEIHIRLLRKTSHFFNLQSDRWERGVVKFCHRYSAVDAWEIERFGYKIAKVSTKLTLLKNLLETQFDYNPKFKEKINEIKADEMRCQPLGRDKNGLAYWYFLDNEFNLRIFREDQDDVADETWELVCRSRDDLAKLIENLEKGFDTKLEKTEQSDMSDASFKSEPTSDTNEDSRDSFYSTKQKTSIGPSPLTIKQEPDDIMTSETGPGVSESDSNLSEPKIVLKIKQGKCEVDSPTKQLKDKFEKEKGIQLKKIKCKLKEEMDATKSVDDDSEEKADDQSEMTEEEESNTDSVRDQQQKLSIVTEEAQEEINSVKAEQELIVNGSDINNVKSNDRSELGSEQTNEEEEEKKRGNIVETENISDEVNELNRDKTGKDTYQESVIEKGNVEKESIDKDTESSAGKGSAFNNVSISENGANESDSEKIEKQEDNLGYDKESIKVQNTVNKECISKNNGNEADQKESGNVSREAEKETDENDMSVADVENQIDKKESSSVKETEKKSEETNLRDNYDTGTDKSSSESIKIQKDVELNEKERKSNDACNHESDTKSIVTETESTEILTDKKQVSICQNTGTDSRQSTDIKKKEDEMPVKDNQSLNVIHDMAAKNAVDKSEEKIDGENSNSNDVADTSMEKRKLSVADDDISGSENFTQTITDENKSSELEQKDEEFSISKATSGNSESIRDMEADKIKEKNVNKSHANENDSENIPKETKENDKSETLAQGKIEKALPQSEISCDTKDIETVVFEIADECKCDTIGNTDGNRISDKNALNESTENKTDVKINEGDAHQAVNEGYHLSRATLTNSDELSSVTSDKNISEMHLIDTKPSPDKSSNETCDNLKEEKQITYSKGEERKDESEPSSEQNSNNINLKPFECEGKTNQFISSEKANNENESSVHTGLKDLSANSDKNSGIEKPLEDDEDLKKEKNIEEDILDGEHPEQDGEDCEYSGGEHPVKDDEDSKKEKCIDKYQLGVKDPEQKHGDQENTEMDTTNKNTIPGRSLENSKSLDSDVLIEKDILANEMSETDNLSSVSEKETKEGLIEEKDSIADNKSTVNEKDENVIENKSASDVSKESDSAIIDERQDKMSNSEGTRLQEASLKTGCIEGAESSDVTETNNKVQTNISISKDEPGVDADSKSGDVKDEQQMLLVKEDEGNDMTGDEVLVTKLMSKDIELEPTQNKSEEKNYTLNNTKEIVNKPKVSRKRKKDDITKTPNESSTDEETESLSPEVKARKIKTAVRKSLEKDRVIAPEALDIKAGQKDSTEAETNDRKDLKDDQIQEQSTELKMETKETDSENMKDNLGTENKEKEGKDADPKQIGEARSVEKDLDDETEKDTITSSEKDTETLENEDNFDMGKNVSKMDDTEQEKSEVTGKDSDNTKQDKTKLESEKDTEILEDEDESNTNKSGSKINDAKQEKSEARIKEEGDSEEEKSKLENKKDKVTLENEDKADTSKNDSTVDDTEQGKSEKKVKEDDNYKEEKKKPESEMKDDQQNIEEMDTAEKKATASQLNAEDIETKPEVDEPGSKEKEKGLEGDDNQLEDHEDDNEVSDDEVDKTGSGKPSRLTRSKAQKRQANESPEEIPAEPALKKSKLRGRVSSKGRGQRTSQDFPSENSSSSDEDIPLSQMAGRGRGGARRGSGRKARRKGLGIRRKKSQPRKGRTTVKKKKEESDEEMHSDTENNEQKKKDEKSTKEDTTNKADPEIDDEATDIEDYSQFEKLSKKGKSKENKESEEIPEDIPTFSDEELGVRRSARVRTLRARKKKSPSPEYFPSDFEDFKLKDDDEEFELDEDLEEDDEDFSLRKKRKAKPVEEEVPKGRNARRYEAKTKKKVQKKVVEEEPEDETPCCKCLKSEQPEWILLCDKCDAGYHTACLRPPLMIIPDGDWFCPPCEQNDLVMKLTEHLKNLDQSIQKNDRLQRRKERLAFVSISLDNVLKEDEETSVRKSPNKRQKPHVQRTRKPKVKKEISEEETEEESESGESSSGSKSSRSRSSRSGERSHGGRRRHRPMKRRQQYSESEEDSSPGYIQRKCRSRNPVSYKFEEFEELINDAIKEDLSIPKEPKPKKVKPLGISRGKDMSNILGVSDEETKPKSKKKRKPRLTELDEDFDDDDTDDYKMSDGSGSQESSASKSYESGASEESVENPDDRRKSSRKSSRRAARRTTRNSRKSFSRYRTDFIVESDFESGDERRGRRRPQRKTTRFIDYNTETEDEDSFATSELDDSDFESKRHKKLRRKEMKKEKKAKGRSGKRQRVKRISSSDNSEHTEEDAGPSVKKKGRKNRSESEESGSETDEETPKQKVKKVEQKKANRIEDSEEDESNSGSETEVSDGTSKPVPVTKTRNVIQSESDEEEEDYGDLEEEGQILREELEDDEDDDDDEEDEEDSDSDHGGIDDEDGWEEVGADSTDDVSSPRGKKSPVQAGRNRNTIKTARNFAKRLSDASDVASDTAVGTKETTPKSTPPKGKEIPIKPMKPAEINTDKNNEPTPKKRGRKPNQPIEDPDQDTQSEESPVKKKRGKKNEPFDNTPAAATATTTKPESPGEHEVDKSGGGESKTDNDKASPTDRKDDSPLQSRNKQNAPVGVVKPEVRQGVIVENKQVIDNRTNENRGGENMVNPLQGMREMAMRGTGDQGQEYGGYGPYPGGAGSQYQNRGMEGAYMGPQGFQNYNQGHQGHPQYGQGMPGPVQNHPYGGMPHGPPQAHAQGPPQGMARHQGPPMNQGGTMNPNTVPAHSQGQYPPNSHAQGPMSPNRFQQGNQYMPPNMQQGPPGYYQGPYGPPMGPDGPQNYAYGPQGPPHHGPGPQSPTYPQGNYPQGHYHPSGFQPQPGPYQAQMQGHPYNSQQGPHPQMGPQGQMQPQQGPYQNMPYNYPHAPQARHPPGYGPQSGPMQGMNMTQPYRPEPQVPGPQYHQLQNSNPNMGGQRMQSPGPMNSPVHNMGSPQASMGSPGPNMNSPGQVKPITQTMNPKTKSTNLEKVDGKQNTATKVSEESPDHGKTLEHSQKPIPVEPAERKGFMMANILEPKPDKSEEKPSVGESG